MRKALQPLQDPFAGELCRGCRGIIQAETFLWKRGIHTLFYERTDRFL